MSVARTWGKAAPPSPDHSGPLAGSLSDLIRGQATAGAVSQAQWQLEAALRALSWSPPDPALALTHARIAVRELERIVDSWLESKSFVMN